MKRFKNIIKKAAAVILTALLLTNTYEAADQPAAKSVLNVAEVSEEQLGLCMYEMLDGFEADETVRTPLYGNAIYTDGAEEPFSPFEGSSHLTLSGGGKVGAELSFLKHPELSKAKSVAVVVFVKPNETAGRITLTLTATGTDAAVTATGEIRAGFWQTAYLPFVSDPGQLVSVKAEISDGNGGEIEAALDCLHSSLVCGMPEDLPLFASSFSSYRGDISYSGSSLVFNVNGRDGFIESSVCNYIITEKYNTLAITLDNEAGAQSAILSCRMNGEEKYSETCSFERVIGDGKSLYYFKIGNFRGNNVLNSFRLTFPGKIKGRITVEKIGLTSYRYPGQYPGTLEVSATGTTVFVSGSVPSYPADSKEIRLYRLLPGEDEERFEELDVTPYRTAAPSKSYTFTLPRKDGEKDNALYKYFVVFSGDSNYYAAAAAYAPLGGFTGGNTGLRSVSLQSDLSLLPYIAPDNAVFTFDTEKIYAEDGSCSEEYLKPFDEAAQRMKKEGVYAAAVLEFPAGSPDIATAEGLDAYISLLEFISSRYEDVLKTVIPGRALNGIAASEAAGSEDRAVRYAAALARTTAYILNPHGAGVLLPVCTDAENGFDAIRFLQMLGEEPTVSGTEFGLMLDTKSAVTPYQSADAKKISSFLSTSLLYNGAKRATVLCAALPDTDTELITAFCSATENCSGVYFYGDFQSADQAKLFAALGSADGAAKADGILQERQMPAASTSYPHILLYKRVCAGIQIKDEAPSGPVSVMFEGRPGEEWYSYDSCRGIYNGAVNNTPAAELAFDFSLGARGRAVFEAQPVEDNGAVYIRICADYLPAETKTVKALITVYGDNGCVFGEYTLNESETASLCIGTDGRLGNINRIAFAVEQNEEETLSTPRICVFDIYAASAASEETVTEVVETEAPKPETQVFVTETAAETEAETEEVKEDGTGRLLVITLCVLVFMFVLCGAVIFILKKASDKKKTEEKSE